MQNKIGVSSLIKKPSISMSKSGLEIKSFEELLRYAELLASSDFLPKGYGVDHKKRVANAMIAIQYGAELGLSPMQSIQSIAVINGMPSIWGDVALSLVRVSGKLNYFKEGYEGDEGTDDFKGVCELKRVGEEHLTKESFSVKDAKEAGLWGRNVWKAYPKRMLRYRARAFALRDKFPDILSGLEVNDRIKGEPINITPNKVNESTKNVKISDNNEQLNVFKHKCMSFTDKETIKDDLNQVIGEASSKLSDEDNQSLKDFATKHMMETLGDKGVNNG